MSGFESYFGLDQVDSGMSAEAMEAFREQMRANAAHIASIKKDEQKQKKKEDKLAAILLRFMQSGTDTHIVNLIAQVLAENIPASLIVAIMSLKYPELQKEIEVNLNMLSENPENSQQTKENSENNQAPQNSSPIAFNSGNLPFEIRVALDLWFTVINDSMQNYPQKILSTAVDVEKIDDLKPKICLVQLAAIILRDYLESKKINTGTQSLRTFMFEILSKIIKNIVDNQKTTELTA